MTMNFTQFLEHFSFKWTPEHHSQHYFWWISNFTYDSKVYWTEQETEDQFNRVFVLQLVQSIEVKSCNPKIFLVWVKWLLQFPLFPVHLSVTVLHSLVFSHKAWPLTLPCVLFSTFIIPLSVCIFAILRTFHPPHHLKLCKLLVKSWLSMCCWLRHMSWGHKVLSKRR